MKLGAVNLRGHFPLTLTFKDPADGMTFFLKEIFTEMIIFFVNMHHIQHREAFQQQQKVRK